MPERYCPRVGGAVRDKFSAVNAKNWNNTAAVLGLWLLLATVFLFAVANLLLYLVVPVDGATIWLRQGPVKVLGTAAGESGDLQKGDVILEVAGRDVGRWLDGGWRTLPPILRRAGQANPSVPVLLERGTELLLVDAPLSPRPGGATAWKFFTHVIVGAAFLAAGTFILVLRGRGAVERRAALIMILMALIEQNEIPATLGAELGLSLLWLFVPLRLLTRWFTYSHVLVFSLTFPRPKPWLKRASVAPLIIHLLNPAVTLVVMAGVAGNLHYRHAVGYSWSKAIYSVYLLLACAILVHTYVTTRSVTSRHQLRWIAWGVIMAVVPNVLLVDLPFLVSGYRLLPTELASLLLLFVPATVAVAILRYRLWDIEPIIKASLLYGTLTFLLGAVYLALVSVFVALLGWSGSSAGEAGNNLAVFFISALVVAFLFSPARDYVQRVIDRLFFRNKLDYPAILADMGRALVTSLLLDDLLQILTRQIPARLNLAGGEVILDNLPSPSTAEYRQLRQGNLVWLKNPYKTIGTLPPPLDRLRQSGMWACVPLLSGDEFLGLYGLGPKKSGEYFNREDVLLLETLARQAGIAVKNARLHRELSMQVRVQRDLEIARQIQLSLLPAHDPLMPGLDIAGFSMPAQEVGGDFYHYFKFDDNRLGIAVGDVSGKGVSAALFMAVSISTLRAQSPHYLHPAELIAEMNNLLHLQMKIRKMNTALLYTIIERQADGGLTLGASNAGLISPLLGRKGEQSRYLDVCGLPLGVMENVSYQMSRLNLHSGDLILLCSDGVVEAMNSRGEMFGFNRLEQFMAECDNLAAGRVIERLRAQVTAFVGRVPQHDDITMVAVRVV